MSSAMEDMLSRSIWPAYACGCGARGPNKGFQKGRQHKMRRTRPGESHSTGLRWQSGGCGKKCQGAVPQDGRPPNPETLHPKPHAGSLTAGITGFAASPESLVTCLQAAGAIARTPER